MTHAFASSAEVANLPALERLMGEINDLQSKLILLVGSSGKTRLLRALARRLHAEPLNVGVTLG
ncbi:MAG TPA: BREX-3 system P-loop-containing protein BrxF, partial [Elusimicrobiota bacterium]|nr:BREX-3 system P-loop-containing protein BrxF [Elusimicrobiota bacterium]